MTSQPTLSAYRFRHPWRDYQKRALDEMEEHLGDDHIHVIAPPGSGKTVLGLEILRRLDRPALILSPTLAIRDQWIDRFVQLFLPEPIRPAWMSTDVTKPGFITSCTYQALHCACRGAPVTEDDSDEESDSVEADVDDAQTDVRADLINTLLAAGIRALVVDEAHHLRSAWWETLFKVKSQLERPVVVALTATPPYDAPPAEWERYREFCGPVDAEIAVPELVRKGDLCAHQDFAHLSTPTESEIRRITEFRENAERVTQKIMSDDELLRVLQSHPALAKPEKYIEKILDDPAFFSGIAIFLNHRTGKAPKELLRIMGLARGRIPLLNVEWLEIMLKGCIHDHADDFAGARPLFRELAAELRHIGAMEGRMVTLRNTRRINKLLATSAAKLGSIAEIVRAERDTLSNELRLVVLTDYIRKSDLPSAPSVQTPLIQMGVVPIFETIRRGVPGLRIGVLSGSFIVIPAAAREKLLRLAGNDGCDVRLAELKHDPAFLEVIAAGGESGRVISWMTRLLTEGDIHTLIGTKSLLGEGWDAPAINSLILASVVGSYMLSNQMRGRAIRSCPQQPGKAANIWHLLCVDTGSRVSRLPGRLFHNPADRGGLIPEDDHDGLTRRFLTFVGVAHRRDVIENGIDRLELGDPPYSREQIDILNRNMLASAADREGLKSRWERALIVKDGKGRMVEEIETPAALLPRGFVFRNMIEALSWQAAWTGAFQFCRSMAGSIHSGVNTLQVVAAVCLVAAVVMLPRALKTLWLWIRHGPVSSSLDQIGCALLDSMIECGHIKTERSKIRVRAVKGFGGRVHCWIDGGTSYERSLYLNALREILDCIDNPRYLIMRRSRIALLIRTDFHAVPEMLAAKKEHALRFQKHWNSRVGPSQLVYTRTLKGRLTLLRARHHSLSGGFRNESRNRMRWK